MSKSDKSRLQNQMTMYLQYVMCSNGHEGCFDGVCPKVCRKWYPAWRHLERVKYTIKESIKFLNRPAFPQLASYTRLRTCEQLTLGAWYDAECRNLQALRQQIKEVHVIQGSRQHVLTRNAYINYYVQTTLECHIPGHLPLPNWQAFRRTLQEKTVLVPVMQCVR